MNGKLSSVTAIFGLLIVPACVGDFGAGEDASDLESSAHEQQVRRRGFVPNPAPTPAQTPVQKAPVVVGQPCDACPPGVVVGKPGQTAPAPKPAPKIVYEDVIVEVEQPLQVNLKVVVDKVEADEPVLLELNSASSGRVLGWSDPVKAGKSYTAANIDLDTKFYFTSKDRTKRFLVVTPENFGDRRTGEADELLARIRGEAGIFSSSSSSSTASGDGFASSSSRSGSFGSRTRGNGQTISAGTRNTANGFEQTFTTSGLTYSTEYNERDYSVTVVFRVTVRRDVAAVGAPAQNTYVEPKAEEAPPAPAQEERRDDRKQGPAQEERRDQAPTQQAPTQQAPTQQAPTQQAPTQQAPTEQAPPPPAEAPDQAAPAQAAPAPDAPAQAGPAQAAPRAAQAAPPIPVVEIRKRIVKKIVRVSPTRFAVGPATEIQIPAQRGAEEQRAPEQTRGAQTPPPPALPEP